MQSTLSWEMLMREAENGFFFTTKVTKVFTEYKKD